jgi:hypothetical protein
MGRTHLQILLETDWIVEYYGEQTLSVSLH